MGSIVRELQREALDISIPASSIVRKALVVARKLSLDEFRIWCEKELNGYTDGDEMPPYRLVAGELKANNPSLGLIPVVMPPQMADVFSRKAILQPLAQLEDVCSNPDSKGFMTVAIPKSIEQTLVGMLEGFYPVFVLHRSGVAGILDAARNIVLDWALKLEEQGVLGEDMAFSEKEKLVAPNVTYNIAQMVNSQIQHDTVSSTQSMRNEGVALEDVAKFLFTLKESIADLHLDPEKDAEINADIQTIEVQINSPKPKSSIIREGLASVRNILEGAAGSALGAKLLEQLPALLMFFSNR